MDSFLSHCTSTSMYNFVDSEIFNLDDDLFGVDLVPIQPSSILLDDDSPLHWPVIKPSSNIQHHSHPQTVGSLSISCKFLHTPRPVATTEESSDSNRAVSHLANLNLQIVPKHNMSTPSLSSPSYFGSTDDQSYSSSSANMSTPLTSSPLSKWGCGMTANKIENDFMSASQNLSDYL